MACIVAGPRLPTTPTTSLSQISVMSSQTTQPEKLSDESIGTMLEIGGLEDVVNRTPRTVSSLRLRWLFETTTNNLGSSKTNVGADDLATIDGPGHSSSAH